MIQQKNQLTSSEGLDTDLDDYVLERKSLQPQIIKLSQIDNVKGAWSIIIQWLVIIFAIGLAIGTLYYFTGQTNLISGFPHLTRIKFIGVVMAYLFAGLIIATRQHALGIIMHEASHYRLFSNRIANDLISDFFCAFPTGLATSLYRFEHIAHHRFTNTNRDPYWLGQFEDPDWNWPKTKMGATTALLRDFLGLTSGKWLKVYGPWSPWLKLFNFQQLPGNITHKERIIFLIFWSLVAIALTLSDNWLNFLFLWFLPQFTFLSVIFRLRGLAEHCVLKNETELNRSRHIDGTLLERLIIAPLNVSIHLDHHLFPSVPQYNLPKLHQILLQDKGYTSNAQLLPNYFSLKNGLFSKIIISD
jgi:fatty acid desaturase